MSSGTASQCSKPSSVGDSALVYPPTSNNSPPASRRTSIVVAWFRQLSVRPASVLCVALAANAMAMPYRGRFHDAILYGFQVANRADNNRYAGDLFLKYGSQDNYSWFSAAIAPLAQLLGLDATFFLIYLAATFFFFYAAQRLFASFIQKPIITAVAMLALAVYRPPIGGLEIFHLNENFLTPRLLAGGLALLGLERMLMRRMFQAIGLLALSTALHPLVACGGWLVLAGWSALHYVPRAKLLTLAALGITVTTAILLTPPLAIRIFGDLDPAWRQRVQAALPCLFATSWELNDWLQVLFTSGILLAAWCCLPVSTPSRNFLTALLVTTGLAALGSMLACWLPYALLLQGQPFRALWLAQLLCLPIALMLAAHWWRRSDWLSRCASVVLIAYLGAAELLLPDLLAVVVVLGAAILRLRWTNTACGKEAWPWQLLAAGLALMAGAQVLAKESYLVANWGSLTELIDLDFAVRVALTTLAPLGLFLITCLFAKGLSQLVGYRRRLQLASLAIALAIHTAAFATESLPSIRAINERHYHDLQFVHEVIWSRQSPELEPPTVYWPLWRLDYIWFDLQAKSYFTAEQLVGNVFSRATAAEGARRIELVNRFEIETARQKQRLISARRQRELQRLFGASFDSPPPMLDDLLKLCADPQLDYAVLRQGFPGWYCAHHQNLFIYDCRAIRNRIEPDGDAQIATEPMQRDTQP